MTRKRFIEVMTSPDFTDGEKFICQAEYSNATLSGFEDALWRILGIADGSNLTRLERAFPGHVLAFRQWTRGDLRQRFENRSAA